MAIVDDIKQLLKEFGDRTVKDLRESVDAKTNYNNTRLGASIKFEFVPKTNGLRAVIRLNDYYNIVDKGRGPGNVSKEGQASILRWAQTRGIVEQMLVKDLQKRLEKQAKNKTKRPKKALKEKDFKKFSKGLAYVISRNIERNGYDGNNFFTDIVEDGRLEELQEKLTELIGNSFEIELYKDL